MEMRKAAEACLVEMIRVFDLDPVCPYHTDPMRFFMRILRTSITIMDIHFVSPSSIVYLITFLDW